MSLPDALERIETWRGDYNRDRSHSSLGYRSPSEFADQSDSQKTRDARRKNRPQILTGVGSKMGTRAHHKGP